MAEPALSEAWFDAKPMVLLIGQYSVGKTSFINYLLGRSFAGSRIGPEMTTDRFVAVMYGDTEKTTPGESRPSEEGAWEPLVLPVLARTRCRACVHVLFLEHLSSRSSHALDAGCVFPPLPDRRQRAHVPAGHALPLAQEIWDQLSESARGRRPPGADSKARHLD
jgi:hypothetical protein